MLVYLKDQYTGIMNHLVIIMSQEFVMQNAFTLPIQNFNFHGILIKIPGKMDDHDQRCHGEYMGAKIREQFSL